MAWNASFMQHWNSFIKAIVWRGRCKTEKNNINVMLKGKRIASRSRIEPLMCHAHVSWVKKALLLEPRAGKETKVRPSTTAVLIDLIVWTFSLSIADRQPRKWKSNWVLKVWKTCLSAIVIQLDVSMCGQVKRGDVGGRESDWWGGYAMGGTSSGKKEIR